MEREFRLYRTVKPDLDTNELPEKLIPSDVCDHASRDHEDKADQVSALVVRHCPIQRTPNRNHQSDDGKKQAA